MLDVAAPGIIKRDFVPGGSVDSARFDPPSDVVAVRPEGAVVRIEAAATGISESLQLEVSTSSGRTLRSGPLQFITDHEAPIITVAAPQAGAWYADGITIAGSVRDPSGVESLQYAHAHWLSGGLLLLSFLMLVTVYALNRRLRVLRA